LALARGIGEQQSASLSLANLAEADIHLGQLSAARASLREALALAQRLGTLTWMVAALGTFAVLAHAEGQTEQALALWGLARHQPTWKSDNQQFLDTMIAE
jgi:hypothetical protein